MEVFNSIRAVQNQLHNIIPVGNKIGLVPTMGSLHEGHLTLVRKSVLQNDITVTSIYINPTQFNNPSDLENYPRSMDSDLELLESEGCDFVFAPRDDEMYFGNQKIRIDFGEQGKIMEGKFRPGHFNGVGLVVAKLLNIIQPDRAYFGEKDLQQLIIIRQLVRELNFGTEIVGVPTVREKSGLAMSSRNKRLNTSQQEEANIIFRALEEGKKELIRSSDIARSLAVIREIYSHQPEVELEYVEFVDLENLEIVEEINGSSRIAICTAAYVGNVRLIDNIILG